MFNGLHLPDNRDEFYTTNRRCNQVSSVSIPPNDVVNVAFGRYQNRFFAFYANVRASSPDERQAFMQFRHQIIATGVDGHLPRARRPENFLINL